MKFRQDISIGENIKQLRLNKGLTQVQVSTQLQLYGCNTSYDVYAKMEQGKYNICISEFLALKHIFDADYSDFFVGLDISKQH